MSTTTLPKPSRRAFRWLALIMLTQVILGSLFVIVVPPLERQDEFIHWDYVRYLRANHRLPDQREQYVQDNPGEFWAPPLHYLLSTLLIAPIPASQPSLWIEPWNDFGLAYQRTAIPDNANRVLHDPATLAFPWQGDWLALRVLRWLSVLLGTLTSIPTFWLAWLVFRDERLSLGAVCWLALRPALVSLNARYNNDPMLLLESTTVLLLCALIVARGATWRRAALLGVLLGVTALTKFTWAGTAFGVPLAFFLAPTWKENRVTSTLQFLLAGGIALLMVGWWFVRNQVLYGDLLGVSLGRNFQAEGRPTFTLVRTSPITGQEVYYFTTRFFKDYWADFGVRGLPLGVHYGLLVVTILLVAGLVYLLRKGRWRAAVADRRVTLFVLLVSAVYLLQLVALFQVVIHGIKARYAYAGFAALAICMQLGLLGLLTWAEPRWPRLKAVSGWLPAALLVPLTLYGALGVMRTSYDLPRRVDDPAKLAGQYDTPADVQFGDTIHLFGYSLSRQTAHPGDTLFFTLCWGSGGPLDEALPYAVHVVDADNYKAAELNTHPGLGMYATTYWEPGVWFCDRGRVPINTDAPAPAVYDVIVKYFHMDTLAPLPATLENEQQVEAFTLGRLALVPRRWPRPGPEQARLGARVAVSGLELSEQGRTARVNVQWHALDAPGTDYTAFVHVFDADGGLAAQVDRQPLDGRFPTEYWPRGAVVDDHIDVPLDDLPPGSYRVVLGLYETESVTRLPAVDASGAALPDNVVQVGTVALQ